MRFRKLYSAEILFAALLAVIGCTEELPLNQIYTDDTDWVPSVSVSKNDYQRVVLAIDRPPRKELLRNIRSYHIQMRAVTDGGFVTIDSLFGMYVAPHYAAPYPQYYYSKPVFSYNTQYVMRTAVYYRTGVVRVSSEIQFTTPVERGKILKRIPAPLVIPLNYFASWNSLVFWKDKLLVLADKQLFQVDTSSGKTTLLKTDHNPPTGNYQQMFQSITISGDTLFSFYDRPNVDWNNRVYTIVKLNLKTLVVDSTLKIQAPQRTLRSIVSHSSNLYAFWWTSQGLDQFSVINSQTGQTIQTLPEGTLGDTYPYELCSDGSNLWITKNSSFNNRIVKIDPLMLAISNEQHNPIFSPQSLTWDGKNFWTIDRDTRTIVKLQLEGL